MFFFPNPLKQLFVVFLFCTLFEACLFACLSFSLSRGPWWGVSSDAPRSSSGSGRRSVSVWGLQRHAYTPGGRGGLKEEQAGEVVVAG